MLTGAQIQMFRVDPLTMAKVPAGTTSHPSLELAAFKQNHSQHWLMNHPTFCFRKSAILAVGNYNNQIHSMCEDFELILRVLVTYGKVHNMPDILLYYRLHPDQLTYGGGKEGSVYWTNKRNEIIARLMV